jgi:FtsP/CotA-like multicopper oxidase with cupredoxin domain
MVDQTLVYTWTFADRTGPQFPGPVLFATEGDRVDIIVSNELDEDHAFSIPGVVDSGIIRPGQQRLVKFRAPKAGTYLYLDPLNEPVNRILGLHGLLVSVPTSGNTPYSDPPAVVQSLFDDFGTAAHFPGHPWEPARSYLWLFSSIDPTLNAMAAQGAAIDPALFRQNFLPQYFTINGKTGFFAAHDEHIAVHGFQGEPALIRSVNAGGVTHSPHIHGNHVYVLTDNNTVLDNLVLLDTWALKPMDRKDVLLPFVQPPSIPDLTWARMVAGVAQERFPLLYPMHCHIEMSQTAAGGNYPQGLVTHWEMEGPIRQ